MCLLFPLLAASRLGARKDAKQQFNIPPFMNALLYSVLSAENRLLSLGVGMPWGSTLYGIGSQA